MDVEIDQCTAGFKSRRIVFIFESPMTDHGVGFG
jgi:hypothetical protein